MSASRFSFPLQPLPRRVRGVALAASLAGSCLLAGNAAAQSLTLHSDALPAPLLPAADVQRLSALIETQHLYFLSPLAPDGRSALVNAGQLRAFVDLLDYSAMPLDAEAAQAFEARSGRAVWVDAQHLAFPIVDTDTDDGEPAWHIATLDRRTGTVTVTDESLPVGQIVALAPGGRWALTLTRADASGSSAGSPAGRTAGARTSRAVPTIRTRLDFAPPRPGSGPQRTPRVLEATTAESRLELFDLHSGARRLVASLPSGSILPEARFDPAGRRFALLTNWLEKAPRTEETLASMTVREAMGQYSLADNPFHRNSRLAIHDTASAQLAAREVRAASFPELAFGFQSTLSWNPSGTRLLAKVGMAAQLAGRAHATFYKPQSTHLLAFDVASTADAGTSLQPSAVLNEPVLTAPGDDGLNVTWLSDDELILAPLAGMDRQLHKYDFSQARLTPLAGTPAGSIVTPLALPAQRELLYFNSSASRAPELWRHQADSGAAHVQTSINQAAQGAAGVREQRVSFTLASGEQRQGYWFAPGNAPWPPVNQRVVLWQAGGPGGEMGNHWGVNVESPHTLLPSFGIGVLMVPLQQRPGLDSRLWNQLADGDNFGAVDIDELAEIAGQVVARGWARADQVGISGCSYGGYMTAQSIVRHPQRYAAANPQCSLLDLVSEFQTGYASHIGYLQGASPGTRWSEYLADSPGFHGASVRTPTLIFHGTQDFLPVGIAENFYADIRSAGTDARILRFVGEPHGLRDSANQLYAAQEQITWFRRYLKPPAQQQ